MIIITRNQEDEQSKATRALCLPRQDDCITRREDIKQCTTENGTNTEPHYGGNNQQRTNNSRTTALKRTSTEVPVGLNAFYWYQIFALIIVVVKTQKLLPYYCNVSSQTNNQINLHYNDETNTFCTMTSNNN